MKAAIRRLIWRRARFRCEYCHLHRDDDDFLAFHLDHVIARQHGGSDRSVNRALSCAPCNFAKGPNLSGLWNGRVIPLFNPRRQVWSRHFEWHGMVLVGKTLAGKVTVKVLNLNSEERLMLRAFLQAEGCFPPPEDQVV